jgi:hypothetical protein
MFQYAKVLKNDRTTKQFVTKGKILFYATYLRYRPHKISQITKKFIRLSTSTSPFTHRTAHIKVFPRTAGVLLPTQENPQPVQERSHTT